MLVCPTDHGITGGVRGVLPEDLESTPRAKRHLLGVTVGEAYLINGYLGSGGFGAVYRAEQKALGRDVALKILQLDMVGDESVVHRFKREARTAAAILDPNVVTLFDYGEASMGAAEEDQVLYIAMELVRGPTLRQVIKREGGLGLHGAIQTGINILRGLAAAHQLGVVHRDLKPGNVLIDESKHRPHFARLFDFGIASIQGSGGHTTQMGQGGVLGTPKYMAPEQWRAQSTAPCTDVYAFGVMLAEMLLGQPPVPKMELVDMAAAHCRSERPEVTLTSRREPVPHALTQFIKKCMAIDPRQRYGTAREALVSLEAIAAAPLSAPVPEVSTAREARDAEGDISYSGVVPVATDATLHGRPATILSPPAPPQSPPAPPGAARPSQPPPPPLRPGAGTTSPLPGPVPGPQTGLQHSLQPGAPASPLAALPQLSAPPTVDFEALAAEDVEEILEVHLDPPRRIWPWALVAVGLLLAVVGWRLAGALQEQAPATPAGALTAGSAADPDRVAGAAPAADAAQVAAPDAAPAAVAVPDAAPVDARTADAVAADAGTADAGIPDAGAPDAAPAVAVGAAGKLEGGKPGVEAERPKGRRPGPERGPKSGPSATLAAADGAGGAGAAAPPSAPATEPAAARPVARVQVAGLDVTPKANPSAADLDLARREYIRGTDAQKRGAPKSAQRYFVNALRQGLDGAEAADAQRRLKQLADEIALEASEF